MKYFSIVSVLGLTCLASLTAQGTTLSIYGQGHVSLDSVDDGQTSSLYTSSSSSRLGIKGSHVLRNNYRILFQIETGVDLTAQGSNDGNGPGESSGQIFTKGRPSFIGLEGNLGQVLIGHMPYLDQWANDYNLFADQVGDLGNLWEASGIPGRVDNAIYLKTLNYSGFEISATYVPEEGVQDTQSMLIKGRYNADDLQVNLTYNALGQGEMLRDDHTSVVLTAAYDFGEFTLGGGYQHETDIAGAADDNRDSYYFGGSVNISPYGRLKAQFAVSQSDHADAHASQFALGYDYVYNPHTTFYVAYASVNNDDNVNFSVNGKGHGDKVVPQLGDNPRVISLGIVYNFEHHLMK